MTTASIATTGAAMLIAGALVLGSLMPADAMPSPQDQQQQKKQDENKPIQPPPPLPPVNWEEKGLSATPIVLESIGFSIHLPLECKVTKQMQGARRLFITSNDGRWMAAVDVDQSSNPETTVDDVVESTHEAIRKAANDANDVSESAIAYARSVLLIDGQSARQLQVEIKRPNGVKEVRLFTVVSPMPTVFVVYTIWCGSDVARDVARLYQASVDSITFEDPASVILDRTKATLAVQKCLDGLTPEVFERMLQPEHWYRIYKLNDRRKEQEIGFYRVTEEVAPRGQLTPGRNPDRYSRAEREKGILITLVARYVLPDGSISEVDSRSWASFDRESEIWSIRSSSYQYVAKNQYLPASISALTGTRTDDLISITLELPNRPVDSRQYRKPQTAYITQVERFLLYRILKPWADETYGSYYLDPSTMKLVFRVDRFEGLEGNPTGEVTCQQHLRQDAPAGTVTLDQTGLIRRIVAATGEITESSTLKEINDKWTDAGLPTTAMSELISKSGGARR